MHPSSIRTLEFGSRSSSRGMVQNLDIIFSLHGLCFFIAVHLQRWQTSKQKRENIWIYHPRFILLDLGLLTVLSAHTNIHHFSRQSVHTDRYSPLPLNFTDFAVVFNPWWKRIILVGTCLSHLSTKEAAWDALFLPTHFSPVSFQ